MKLTIRLPLLLTGLFCLSLLSACQSAREPGGTSHAVVQINGRTLKEIQDTTAVVFGEEGYSLRSRSAAQMVFSRPGSRRDAAKYGGWSGEGVTMQVRVAFTELAGGSYRVQADAYAEQNASDPFFQEENRAMMLNRIPYRRLLDDVAKRLEKPEGT
jgi:hypothetical protein